MSTETLSARQECDNQSLLYALETAVRAKHALWDALLQLAEIGYPGEEPPDQESRISILTLVRRQYTPALPRIPRLSALNPAHHLRR